MELGDTCYIINEAERQIRKCIVVGIYNIYCYVDFLSSSPYRTMNYIRYQVCFKDQEFIDVPVDECFPDMDKVKDYLMNRALDKYSQVY